MWIARVVASSQEIFIPPEGVHKPDGDCGDTVMVKFV